MSGLCGYVAAVIHTLETSGDVTAVIEERIGFKWICAQMSYLVTSP